MQLELISNSPEQTEALGALLGRLLEPGDLVTLDGELGGGKTCLVRGIVAGFAPDSADQVASPTFAILNEYPGPVPICHCDCYRLRGADDAIALGIDELLHGNSLCLVEWPLRIASLLPDSYLELQFAYQGETSRLISLVPHGSRMFRLLDLLHPQLAAFTLIKH